MNKYAPKNIDRIQAQSLYDSGMSLRKLATHFNVCINTISRLKLETRTISESIKMNPVVISDAAKSKLSKLAKDKNLGGYRPHPNKGEKYNDIWFDSKWEVKVAQSLDEHGISWIRPKTGFIWTDSGKKYYPDFYLPKFDVYLDPKNSYLMKKDAEKINEAQHRNNIRVLLLNESQLSWDQIQLLL